jgi:hypothetical protein
MFLQRVRKLQIPLGLACALVHKSAARVRKAMILKELVFRSFAGRVEEIES